MNLEERKAAGVRDRSKHPGYGACKCCGRPWPTCQSHTTQFNETEGVFPLCEECWAELSVDERLPYYDQVVDGWMSYGRPDHNGTPWSEVRQQIHDAVKAGG